MTEEGDIPSTNEGLAASTKRLADWTFSLQGVGADLKKLMADLKTWAHTVMTAKPSAAGATVPTVGQAPGISGSSFNGGITINLGGPTVALVITLLVMMAVAAWIIGQNTAERRHQEREAAAQAATMQAAIAKQTADLQRAWTINTEQLQRDWFLNTTQLQRDWEKQTAMLSEKTQDLQRQYRMTELKLDDWTVVAHRSGLVLPGDYTRGPQGNLDSESFTKPKGK